MGAFLLFVFVFASQVIGGFNTKLPPPTYGDAITILSVDGGGIKGIIPSVILEHLETALKSVTKDEKASLSEYFDVIAGTSTGGLIAAILASPGSKDPNRPALTAPEILQFYLDVGPSIFNASSESATGWTEDTLHSKFDGKVLHEKARELLQETRLHDTLTNVVIPTFDILKLHPVIFSTLKSSKVPSLNAKLSDIAIGTSAAPSQLPPYYFKDGDNEFNLVDGAITASNPALIAVSEAVQELMKENEPKKIVLLSLGCGSTGPATGYPVWIAQNFPATIWIPVIAKAFGASIENVNQYHLKTRFPTSSSDNYQLRIDEYSLDPTTGSDNVTPEGLAKLVKAGQTLLGETVKAINVTSFEPYELPNEGTNSQALERLAEFLYKEKKLRLKNKAAMEKMGRPFMEDIRMFGMK